MVEYLKIKIKLFTLREICRDLIGAQCLLFASLKIYSCSSLSQQPFAPVKIMR